MVPRIANGCDQYNDQQYCCISGRSRKRAPPGYFGNRLTIANNVQSAGSPAFIGGNSKGDNLVDPRAQRKIAELVDVHKHLLGASAGRDETVAPVFVPVGDLSLGAHSTSLFYTLYMLTYIQQFFRRRQPKRKKIENIQSLAILLIVKDGLARLGLRTILEYQYFEGIDRSGHRCLFVASNPSRCH